MTKLLKQGVRAAALILVVHLAVVVIQAGEIIGTVSVAGTNSAKNVAVWIGAIQGKTFAPPAEHVIVYQKRIEFIPHMLVILQGTTVDFVSTDSMLHSLFWPGISGNQELEWNMGNGAIGQKLPFTFNNLGIVPLEDNIHDEMYGYIVVVSTPYFAVTGPDGSFDIKGIPSGHYTLEGWSELVSFRKIHSQPVDVASGGTTVHVNLAR